MQRGLARIAPRIPYFLQNRQASVDDADEDADEESAPPIKTIANLEAANGTDVIDLDPEILVIDDDGEEEVDDGVHEETDEQLGIVKIQSTFTFST